MADHVKIQNLTLRLGDRFRVDGGSKPPQAGIYALTFISPTKPDYIGFKSSPRPGIIRRHGYGLTLDFFDDKKLRALRPTTKRV